ncbi:MAG: T9SS type A sorting domain-containing protein, partial [Bacteroidota bacterium]
HTRSGLAEVLNVVCFDSCADCIVGVAEMNFLNSLNVYPNPANDFVLLSFGQETSNKIYVRVLNQLGQVVAIQNVGTLPAGNNTVRVELADLSAGIYAVELSNGKERATVQIAVE